MKRKYIFSLILIVGMITGMTTTNAYTTTLDFTGVTIAFDISHGGYHTTEADLAPIIGNLTAAGNTVIYINETWGIPDDVAVLFLTQSDDNYTTAEKADIKTWFELGDKLLWASGDSDYGGFFNPWSINQVLDTLGGIIRLGGCSIEDPDFNDGSAYRTAPSEIGYGDSLYDDIAIAVTTGMTAGIIAHGPCAIIAYNGYDYRDLRYGKSVFPIVVNVILTYGENATAADSDTSDGDLDVYDGLTGGLFPAVVHENFTDIGSNLILSGEAIYTNYKFMYGQNTENGFYNGGIHFGQMLVNNILNYFVVEPEEPEPTNAFALIPLAAIGVIYAISLRKK
ncbi:MAG: hypothetical protein ACTSSN_11525 [Candidatus Heimdallarchaeaceae archaeon]